MHHHGVNRGQPQVQLNMGFVVSVIYTCRLRSSSMLRVHCDLQLEYVLCRTSFREPLLMTLLLSMAQEETLDTRILYHYRVQYKLVDKFLVHWRAIFDKDNPLVLTVAT